jgi:hypothetical protein
MLKIAALAALHRENERSEFLRWGDPLGSLLGLLHSDTSSFSWRYVAILEAKRKEA